MSQELINYLTECLDAVKDEKFSIFIREIRSRLRDYDIALASEVLTPLEEDNTIKKDVQARVAQLHIKKAALIDLLEYFEEDSLNDEIIKLREKLQEDDDEKGDY
jgi:hypothetical protein